MARALDELKAPAAAPTKDSLDVVFYRDSKMDDGRHNNNGWLQELPDPITKLTWDNAVLLSPATAKELGVYTERNAQNQKFFDYIVEITLNGRTVRGPVWIQPGMADNTVGLALGYGREKTGRVGQRTGFNAYKLRTSDNLYYASGATLTGHGRQELRTGRHAEPLEHGRPARRARSQSGAIPQEPEICATDEAGRTAGGFAALSQSARQDQSQRPASVGHVD